jgi:hypothetical protein
MNNLNQDLPNKLVSVQFGQDIMKIEEIDSVQNTGIFRMLNISKKSKVCQLQVEVVKKVVTSPKMKYSKKKRFELYFTADVTRSFKIHF